jgi:hypothetical protein
MKHLFSRVTGNENNFRIHSEMSILLRSQDATPLGSKYTTKNYAVCFRLRSERSVDDISSLRLSWPAHSALLIHHLHHPQYLSRLLRTKSFVVTISMVIIIVVAFQLPVV